MGQDIVAELLRLEIAHELKQSDLMIHDQQDRVVLVQSLKLVTGRRRCCFPPQSVSKSHFGCVMQGPPEQHKLTLTDGHMAENDGP